MAVALREESAIQTLRVYLWLVPVARLAEQPTHRLRLYVGTDELEREVDLDLHSHTPIPLYAYDAGHPLELLLDAVFKAAAQTQAFLKTELANWLSVDGRLTFDDFKRFFPDLPGAAAVSELAVATLFAALFVVLFVAFFGRAFSCDMPGYYGFYNGF